MHKVGENDSPDVNQVAYQELKASLEKAVEIQIKPKYEGITYIPAPFAVIVEEVKKDTFASSLYGTASGLDPTRNDYIVRAIGSKVGFTELKPGHKVLLKGGNVGEVKIGDKSYMQIDEHQIAGIYL